MSSTVATESLLRCGRSIGSHHTAPRARRHRPDGMRARQRAPRPARSGASTDGARVPASLPGPLSPRLVSSRARRRSHVVSASARTPSRARSRRSARFARPFELLESKLRVPRRRSGAVQRRALIGELEAASPATPLVFLSAGPGWGKTTLLAQWSSKSPRPFAWVSVDEHDNDPIVLLTYVAAALDRVTPLDRACSTRCRRRAPRSRERSSRASGRLCRRWTRRSSWCSMTCTCSTARRAWMPSSRSRNMFPRARSSCSPRAAMPASRSERCARRAWRWRSGRTSFAWTRPKRASSCERPVSTSAVRKWPSSRSTRRAGPRACTWPRCLPRRAAPAWTARPGSGATTTSWPTTCARSSSRGSHATSSTS